MPSELVDAYDTSLLFPLPAFPDEEKLLFELEKAAQSLKVSYIQQNLKKLALEIKQLEGEGREKEVKELKKQYSDLTTHL